MQAIPGKTKRMKFNMDLAGFTERQMEAIKLLKSGTVKYMLYGGALGGGKSYFLRWYCIRRLLEFAERDIRHVQVMLACEDYPSLKDRQLSRIGREFPKWLGTPHADHKEYGRCFILNPEYGSGVICFRNLDDPSKYQSAEFAMICVDELTKNPYETFTMLRTRIRWPGLTDEECFFIGGTNPGGVGHGWCKQLWMDRDYPEEFRTPTDYTGKFAYVPSKAKDNPHLDQSYWAMLDTLPSVLRAAFRDGDWNIWYGQAFPEFSKQIHVCGRPPVPPNANLYMTFDWGFGAPFSVGWWWVNNDGQLFRFDEWYGWSGQPNQGFGSRIRTSLTGSSSGKRRWAYGAGTSSVLPGTTASRSGRTTRAAARGQARRIYLRKRGFSSLLRIRAASSRSGRSGNG